MDAILHRAALKKSKKIVIKIGTNTIIDKDGKFNHNIIKNLARDIHDLKFTGRQFTIVSSGAIGLGNHHMQWQKTKDILMNQCSASIGQTLLMHAYHNCFKEHSLTVSQLLLTYSDIFDTKKETVIRNLTKKLIEQGIIPIINENDSVSTEEITFGDNDILSAHVSGLINADLLIILTDTDGLYKDIEKEDTINFIETIDPQIHACIHPKKSKEGKGGMSSKLLASGLAAKHGIKTVIAQGTEKNIIKKILNGETTGTLLNLNGGNRK